MNVAQLDTRYRVGLHLRSNSILGIELIPLRTLTRYQVSSWGSSGDQLDTKYRVGILLGINSIPSIELLLYLRATRYLVSSYRSLYSNLCYVRTVRVRLTWTPTDRASWMPLLVGGADDLLCAALLRCSSAVLLLRCSSVLLLRCSSASLTLSHALSRFSDTLTLSPSLTIVHTHSLLDTRLGK